MPTYPVGHVFSFDEEKPTYVYGLRERGEALFYIGVSDNPPSRFYHHRVSGVQAVSDKLKSCKSPEMVILSAHELRGAALKEEDRLIRTTPGLLNQEQRIDRTRTNERHPVFAVMMQRVK